MFITQVILLFEYIHHTQIILTAPLSRWPMMVLWVWLTVDEAQVTRVLTGELAADLTPPTRLQPLLSKHLDVVELRPFPVLSADLMETMATGQWAHTHTHTHRGSAHLTAVEDDQLSQFGDEQLIECSGVSVAARQRVMVTEKPHQTGQLRQLVHHRPLRERETTAALDETDPGSGLRAAERIGQKDALTSAMLLWFRFRVFRAGNMAL